MKTIEVSDEMYEFLMNLSKEINTQDHRCTQMPYFFQIETEERCAAYEGQGTEIWADCESTLETDNEIKERIFEIKEWDLQNKADQKAFKKLDPYEIEDILENGGWHKYNVNVQKVYQNAFFTAKACKEHIQQNKHHYKNPIDYLSYASRNPELEKVFEFLCGLTGGKLHI